MFLKLHKMKARFGTTADVMNYAAAQPTIVSNC